MTLKTADIDPSQFLDPEPDGTAQIQLVLKDKMDRKDPFVKSRVFSWDLTFAMIESAPDDVHYLVVKPRIGDVAIFKISFLTKLNKFNVHVNDKSYFTNQLSPEYLESLDLPNEIKVAFKMI